MNYILNISQIIIAILLITVILIQSKGSGLSSLFGGSDTVYRTKRGAEKFMHYLTIILSIAFLGTALAQLFI